MISVFDDRRYSIGEVDSSLCELRFDFGFYSVGYEKRSSFVPNLLQSTTTHMVGIELGGSGIWSYDANLLQAKQRNGELIKKSSLGLASHYPGVKITKAYSKIFVDVSSMDRRTMSLLIYKLLSATTELSATIYFLYAPAKFKAPAAEQLPVDFAGPMNAILASTPKDPKLPTVLILGVGYEVGLALGVVEFFEPARVLAYVPRGTDRRYDHAVNRVNAPLFADQQYIDRISYNLLSPPTVFVDLKEHVLSLRDQARVILVPLGPKIFTSMAIILGYLYAPDLTVWRVSSAIDWPNAEREADGSVLGFALKVAAPTAPL